MNSKFLQLTAELNALDYFEKAISFIRETEESDIAWKWVAISLHGALYGFLVSACYGTNCMAVVEGKNKDHLISFGEALKRCEEGREAKALVVTEGERKSIDSLKRFLRDNYEHFRPRANLVKLDGITMIALDYVRMIETLATQGWVGVRLHEDGKLRVVELAAEARTLLSNSNLHLELYSAQH